MDLEKELDRLYRLPLRQFIGERNELVKRLRQGGDREGAARVKALAKPSLTAWAVNQLHFRQPAELAALRAAGEQLRRAHLSGGEDHRTAIRARREAIARLLTLTDEILEAGGYKPSRAHRQRISQTLEALASEGGEAGRLTQDLEPPGFEALANLAAALESSPRRPRVVSPPRPRPVAPPRETPKPVPLKRVPAVTPESPGGSAKTIDFAAGRRRREEQARHREEEARRRHRERVERLEEKLAAARQAREEIEARIADLGRRAEDARGRHRDAEQEAAAATAAAEEAERRAQEARRRAEEAARTARQAQQAAVAAQEAAAATQEATAAAAAELEAAQKKIGTLEAERRRIAADDPG